MSGARRWVWAALQAALIFALSSRPGDAFPEPPIPMADKAVHLGLYAHLGAALVHALGGRPVVAAAMGVAYGITDELHQAFVPRRTPDGWDVVADALGAVLGAALWHVRRRRAARAA